jgi:hypothetical protein
MGPLNPSINVSIGWYLVILVGAKSCRFAITDCAIPDALSLYARQSCMLTATTGSSSGGCCGWFLKGFGRSSREACWKADIGPFVFLLGSHGADVFKHPLLKGLAG